MTKKQIYDRYMSTVNMTYTELFNWSKTKCSKYASLSRFPIMRNLRLLRKPFSKWNNRDKIDALRTISFINRMKGVKRGKIICGNKYSRRDIALLNWAYNPFKSSKSIKYPK